MLSFVPMQFHRTFWLSLFGMFVGALLFSHSAAAIQNDLPGVVITESSQPKNWYCGRGSIVVLPNGDYLVSMGYEGKKVRNETEVHISKNKGKDWKKLSTIKDLWGASFVTKGDQVFLIGAKGAFARASVVVSSDNGATWSNSEESLISDMKLNSVPTAVLIHNDRIWRSFTSIDWGKKMWSIHLYWAPVKSDWLDANSWNKIERARGKLNFLGGNRNQVHRGNPIPMRSGIALLASCQSKSNVDTAALLPVSADGKSIEFEGWNSLIDFPGGRSKFTARFDEKSKKYWAVVNKQEDPFALNNNQVLISSTDLKDWTVNSVLFRHVDHFYFGKRHADWVIDGEDLILVSMATWNGPNVSEQPNLAVFDRVKNFRSLNSAKVSELLGEKSKPFSFANTTMKVTGKHVESKYLVKGARTVTGFNSKFVAIPKRIKGWGFVRTRGGFPCMIEVKAKKDCKILMITSLKGTGVIDVTGWTLEPERLKGENNVFGLFSRKLKKGETVILPQGTWGGSQLLIPPAGVEVE